MAILDYWVIIIFSIGVVVAGVALSDRKADMKSYFAAGGTLPWWLSGLSLFMSFFSAGTFVVWGSIAYEYGWVAVMIQWGMCIAGFGVGYFIAPAWRKTGVITAGEFIQKRFGTRVQKFYTYAFLFLAFAYTGAFLYPVAKLVNVSTGFSIEYSIILLGAVIILYTAAGGLWAVIVTDVLQFVILTAAVLVVVPLALEGVGGPGGFVEQAPAGFFNLFGGEYTPGFWLAFCFYNAVFIGGNWAYVQRYTSVSTPGDAKKAGKLFGVLYLVSPVIWMLPPMIFRVAGNDLSGLENEGAYFMLCKQVLPAGMLGLMLGGMIFATASSVNTTLNMSAAVFTNDIFKNLRPDASNRSLMRSARLSTVLFGILTILAALMVPRAGGIVEVVLSVGALTGVPLYGPPVWALFSRRQTAFSIYFATAFSLGVNLFFKFLSPALLGIRLDRTEEMVLGVSLPLLLLLFFEGWYAMRPVPAPAGPMTGSLVPETSGKQGTPVNPAPPAGDPGTGGGNRQALKVLGIALLCTGALIFVLGILAPHGRLPVLLVASVILLFSMYLLRKAKKERA